MVFVLLLCHYMTVDLTRLIQLSGLARRKFINCGCADDTWIMRAEGSMLLVIVVII